MGLMPKGALQRISLGFGSSFYCLGIQERVSFYGSRCRSLGREMPSYLQFCAKAMLTSSIYIGINHPHAPVFEAPFVAIVSLRVSVPDVSSEVVASSFLLVLSCRAQIYFYAQRLLPNELRVRSDNVITEYVFHVTDVSLAYLPSPRQTSYPPDPDRARRTFLRLMGVSSSNPTRIGQF